MTYSIHIRNKDLHCSVAGKSDLMSELMLTNTHGRIIFGCRGGGCGICRVKVIEGTFETGLMSASQITPEDLANGEALACKLFPTSDLVIDVMGKRFKNVSYETSIASVITDRG